MGVRVEPLADHPEAIPILARWHHAEWGWMAPDQTIDDRVAQLETTARPGGIPSTVVALDGDEPVGSASLVESDMATHPELTPWLASVYVAESHRRRGIGSGLVRRIVDEAARLGVDRLWLFTPDQEALYARLGWRVESRERYRGEDVVVMAIDLEPAGSRG